MRAYSLLTSTLFLGSLLLLSGCDKEEDGGKTEKPKADAPRKEETKKEEQAKSEKPKKEHEESAAKKNEKHNKETAGNKKPGAAAERYGWNDWRGPSNNGISPETGLPEKIEADKAVWTFPISGRGTPIIAGDKVYFFGWSGEGPDLREHLVCVNEKDGKEIWRQSFNDFLSDTVYSRYTIGSPTVDADTGNVLIISTAGEFACFNGETGKEIWRHSLMEEIGKMTFPNARTGCASIHGDMAIVHQITSNWGAHGPAQDRFYAFDLFAGRPLWSSAPGAQPQDNSFSTPVYAQWNGKHVFYASTGCGHIVCIDALNGQPLWRLPFSRGGVNSNVVLYKDNLICIHGRENLDTSQTGRLISLRIPKPEELPPPANPGEPSILTKKFENWRNTEIGAFSSSPIVVGNKIYATVDTGELFCMDVDSGKTLWSKKLGTEQLHSSPVFADGRIYVPILDGNFFVIKPGETDCEILSQTKLEGTCNGSPAVAKGRVYVMSTSKLYCFGRPVDKKFEIPKNLPPAEDDMARNVEKGLYVIPSDVLLRPGQKVKLNLAEQEYNLEDLETLPHGPVTWAPFIPATAKVKANISATVNEKNELIASSVPGYSAGMLEATLDGKHAYIRGRVIPDFFKEDFEKFEPKALDEKNPTHIFAFPPLPWIGARLKWEVVDLNGNKVLAKTLDVPIFQRSTAFIGHPDMSNYTIEADVMSDGNKRMMSTVGVINQRYLGVLDGNWQKIEVTSNQERVKESVPYAWKANEWQHIKMRVDVAADGVGTIRVKAWKKGDPEPEKWNLEFTHKNAHKQGSPGYFGFSPSNQKRVFVDNLEVTPNK